ncbi:MAG TPA: TRAP transporter large permease [Candidatus Methylomirabilis sp.]|nr:TRAP transporter large permease [Candidatus Methylomirabilis sp.]
MLTLLIVTFAILLASGMPIAFAMSGSALAALVFLSDFPLDVFIQKTFSAGSSFSLLAIPFFVLAGELMTVSRLTDGLVELCDALVGHVKSGMASVSVLACMIFAGISGSGVADTAAIGSVVVPQLISKGYPRGMAASLLATAGALGPIIPPSILMIIYGSIAELSIGRLFLAGAMPGVLMGLGFMAVAYVWNTKRGWESGSGKRFSLQRVRTTFRGALLALVTPIIIIGGIVSGAFTATEAGVVAAAYALVAALATRRLAMANIRAALIRSGLIATLPLFIIATAAIFGWILAVQHFPEMVQSFLLSASLGSRHLAAALILSFLVALGFFVEVISIMIIFTPILAPMAGPLGFDPIHWGLMMVLAINMGGVTPPVASQLYVAGSIAGCGLDEMSRYVLPFVGVMYVVLILCLFVPGVAMFLPRLVFG